MQAIARWTNLSETAFLLAPSDPGADYRVRIFTTGGELPFAGHPTLGTAHAFRESGCRPRRPGRLVQQCGVGLVELAERAPDRWAFAAPLRASGRCLRSMAPCWPARWAAPRSIPPLPHARSTTVRRGCSCAWRAPPTASRCNPTTPRWLR
ncbi:phenazine biosynthesis-like domain-containing protein 2 [Dorcoceras hygrometricum]|uniref:Phenazine biosynthesis-like domain-containing protein 2 n=1 Tax=Dorcoceras hygrometricum TaxID=472368 RepID=A0A2Z7A789_9LAMI|nr:phenazine biosynthesis-like domain-containing protein 2 [Dorcoceras hygrometricum]